MFGVSFLEMVAMDSSSRQFFNCGTAWSRSNLARAEPGRRAVEAVAAGRRLNPQAGRLRYLAGGALFRPCNPGRRRVKRAA